MLRLWPRPWRRVLAFDGLEVELELPGAPSIARGDWVTWNLLAPLPGGRNVYKGQVRAVEHNVKLRTSTYYVELSDFEKTETI